MAELPPRYPSSPLTKKRSKKERKKEREKERKEEGYDPIIAAPSAPELRARSWALSPEPAPYRHFISFGRELPDFSGRQEIPSRLHAMVHTTISHISICSLYYFPHFHYPHGVVVLGQLQNVAVIGLEGLGGTALEGLCDRRGLRRSSWSRRFLEGCGNIERKTKIGEFGE